MEVGRVEYDDEQRDGFAHCTPAPRTPELHPQSKDIFATEARAKTEFTQPHY
jgi:hypothetical protein